MSQESNNQEVRVSLQSGLLMNGVQRDMKKHAAGTGRRLECYREKVEELQRKEGR